MVSRDEEVFSVDSAFSSNFPTNFSTRFSVGLKGHANLMVHLRLGASAVGAASSRGFATATTARLGAGSFGAPQAKLIQRFFGAASRGTAGAAFGETLRISVWTAIIGSAAS